MVLIQVFIGYWNNSNGLARKSPGTQARERVKVKWLGNVWNRIKLSQLYVYVE